MISFGSSVRNLLHFFPKLVRCVETFPMNYMRVLTGLIFKLDKLIFFNLTSAKYLQPENKADHQILDKPCDFWHAQLHACQRSKKACKRHECNKSDIKC